MKTRTSYHPTHQPGGQSRECAAGFTPTVGGRPRHQSDDVVQEWQVAQARRVQVAAGCGPHQGRSCARRQRGW